MFSECQSRLHEGQSNYNFNLLLIISIKIGQNRNGQTDWVLTRAIQGYFTYLTSINPLMPYRYGCTYVLFLVFKVQLS